MASNTVDGSMPRATEELRIVLVGKTGAGKSTSGNTILGREAFESVMSPKSITDECSQGRAAVDGQNVVVIDTPSLFGTRHDVNTKCRHINQCISYACPGPHIFLIVIRLDRFTEEEMETVELIQKLFGQAADRYSMVLFTRGDNLKETTIQKFIEQSQDLQELVDRCHGQYHVFNNKLKTGPQVTKLLQKIRNIVEKNGGSHYTNEMFQAVERAIEEEKQRILKEKEAEMCKEKEQLKRKMEAEFDEKFKNVMEKERQERERQEKERQAKRRKVRRRQVRERQERERQQKERQEWERQLRSEMQAEYKEQLRNHEEKYREKQNIELVVARERQDREHQDREPMQNMFMALGMQNMKNNMEIKHLREQQKWEMEKLRMEMQHREESASKERQLDRA